ncbi:sialate O-acetylesterase isoform X1 [Ambystoma mexicanum]|uniref:sialate O-acetylesterase isoform X1 n=1 Tax=Ambystoma mexicanum TaxID=8296 RepID=UPI0037E870D8
MTGSLVLCIFLSAFSPQADALFDFASYYADHMVLQMAPAKAVIWGYGDAGGVVTISIFKEFDGIMKKSVHVKGNLGIWKAALDPVEHGGPYRIHAEQNFMGEITSITIEDIFFGDVWLCGGQSNMEMTVLQIYNASKELSEAYLYPQVRLFTASLVYAKEELYDLAKVDLQWSLPTPETLGHGEFTYFSAVCWLFGRYLYDTLKYPIGLVESCWGGTPVEAWSSPRSLHECGLPNDGEREKRHVHDFYYEREYESFFGPEVYSVLWNAMIHPLLNMTIKGAIWYQGEANTNLNTDLYNCTFPAMIDDWRASFHEGSEGQTQKDFPFGFVQLSTNVKTPICDNYPVIRWHQTDDFGYAPNPKMPNTFMAVAMDLCDETSPFASIHPRDKQSVARRLSLGARAVAYGETGISFQGPFPEKITIAAADAYMNITYNQKLHTMPANCSIFEVGCSSGPMGGRNDVQWTPVKSLSFSPQTVTVSYKGCCAQAIAGVRYAWSDWPCDYKHCPIYSADGTLPAPPFLKYFPD